MITAIIIFIISKKIELFENPEDLSLTFGLLFFACIVNAMILDISLITFLNK